jgi:hypothetical protein
MTTSGVDSETSPDRPDQQRPRVSRAWLVTQAEGKPPSAGRAAGRRLLVRTRSSDVGSADRVAASRLFRQRRRGYRSACRAAVSPAVYGAHESAAGSGRPELEKPGRAEGRRSLWVRATNDSCVGWSQRAPAGRWTEGGSLNRLGVELLGHEVGDLTGEVGVCPDLVEHWVFLRVRTRSLW